MKGRKIGLAILGLAFLLPVLDVNAIEIHETRERISEELAKPIIRGGIVFKSYCALCHGEKGDGKSRTIKLYPEYDLTIKITEQALLEDIIRQGGEKVGRSPFMPPWQDELSEEQIMDVISYIATLSSVVQRGEVVFKTNCVLCHGIKADGKGRASVLYDPPPANLTKSDKNDDYKRMIITMGGAAMGRSPMMPVWGEQLSAQEIEDVVAYLRTVLVKE